MKITGWRSSATGHCIGPGWCQANLGRRSTACGPMGAGDHVAQGDWEQGGVVTEPLHTPGVGHITGHAASDVVSVREPGIRQRPWARGWPPSSQHWTDWPGRPEDNAGLWPVSLYEQPHLVQRVLSWGSPVNSEWRTDETKNHKFWNLQNQS